MAQEEFDCDLEAFLGGPSQREKSRPPAHRFARPVTLLITREDPSCSSSLLACDWCGDDGWYSLRDRATGDTLMLCADCAQAHARAMLHERPIVEDRARDEARAALRIMALVRIGKLFTGKGRP